MSFLILKQKYKTTIQNSIKILNNIRYLTKNNKSVFSNLTKKYKYKIYELFIKCKTLLYLFNFFAAQNSLNFFQIKQL